MFEAPPESESSEVVTLLTLDDVKDYSFIELLVQLLTLDDVGVGHSSCLV
jgi:hypothetical protein